LGPPFHEGLLSIDGSAVAVAGLASFYSLLSLAHYWTAPMNTQTQIDLRPKAPPMYAMFSVARIAAAYAFSLVLGLIFGYVAAHSSKAERLMIPLLDTLQSIPVLCFLPGVMISMVALFPTKQFELELGSILLIFTGQVWNMAFSVLLPEEYPARNAGGLELE
jgi:NitT/TauT family transport system permease protein